MRPIGNSVKSPGVLFLVLLDSLCFQQWLGRERQSLLLLSRLLSDLPHPHGHHCSHGRKKSFRPHHSLGPLSTQTHFQLRILLGMEAAARKNGQGAGTEDIVILLPFKADLKYLPQLTCC